MSDSDKSDSNTILNNALAAVENKILHALDQHRSHTEGLIQHVTDKLSALECDFQRFQRDGRSGHGEHAAQPNEDLCPRIRTPIDLRSVATQDIQGEFDSIKDSLSRVKLPPELRLNESRVGIGRTEQPLFALLARSARYVETSIKYLSSLDSDPSERTLEDLFRINFAHLKYLQEEYSAVLVQSQFDPKTSKIFKSLQRNTSGLSGDALDNLRHAAAISAVATPQRPERPQGHTQRWNTPSRFQRSYRGNHSQGGRQDVYSQMANRSIPPRRQDYQQHRDSSTD